MAVAMEKELQCVICLNLYEEPHLLPCGHSFCKKCLRDMLCKSPRLNCTAAGSDSRDSDESASGKLGQSDRPKDDASFRCPTCRRQVDLTLENLSSLVRNVLLESIVECFMKEQNQNSASESSLVCDICGDADGRQATTKCEQCQVSYCEQCLRSCHPNRGVFSKHTLISVSDNEQRQSLIYRPVNCHVHSDEKLKLYCQRCHVPVCYVCERSGGHKEHEVIEASDAYMDIRAKLTDDLNALVDMKEATEKFVTSLQDTGQSIQNEAKTIRDSISRQCKEFQTIIARKEREMLDTVSEDMTDKLCHVQDKMTSCKDKLNNTEGLVQYTNRVLEETNEYQVAIFLSLAASLRDRLQRALEKRPNLELEANCKNFDNVVFNFGEVREAVGRLEARRIEIPKAPKITSARVVDRNTIILSLKHPPCDVRWYDVSCGYGDGSLTTTMRCLLDDQSEGSPEEYHIHLGNLDFEAEYKLSARVINAAGTSPFSESVKVKTHAEAIDFKLDPSTAHEALVLSDDGKSVSRQKNYVYPYLTTGEKLSPGKRFIRRATCVLGDVTLSEGEHYWEVEASNSGATNYAIGVARGDCDRNTQLGADQSSWCLEIMGLTLKAYHNDRSAKVHHALSSSPVHNFSVYVNFYENRVMFFDRDFQILLHCLQFDGKVGCLCPAFDLTSSRAKLTIITNKTVPEYVKLQKVENLQ